MLTPDPRTGFYFLRRWDELVTCAAQSKDMHRIIRLVFELLPKSQNVSVDGARMKIALVTEDLAEYFVAGNDSLRILHKEFEKLELVRRHSHRLTVQCGFDCCEVLRKLRRIPHDQGSLICANAGSPIAHGPRVL